jgi:UPF0755 protein
MKVLRNIFLISFAVILLFGFVEVFLFLHSTPSPEKQEQIVNIQKGDSFRKISKHLKNKGVITNKIKFYFLARLQGKVRKIKAGEYLLYTNMTPGEVLDALVSGKTYLYRATIPEGYNMSQIADVYASLKLVSKNDFLKKCKDPVLLEELKILGPSVEGYLFPESYFFSNPISSEKIIRTMVQRFRENFSDALKRKAKKLGFSQHQIVILASIIEKETSASSERKLISAVFHNRLKIKMKLQSDPTVIYGMKDYSGDIRKKDLLTPTAYNTYTKKGLPKGPIANPGKESLEAAVQPAYVKYLYFVSKNDGTHFFSVKYKDHINAVNRYQKRRKK